MKKWFRRNGIEFVLGIGLSLFFINHLTDQTDDLYIFSIPLVVFGLMKLYQRHFDARYYFGESLFAYDTGEGDDDDLYNDAEEAVREAGKASTSYLQRKLRIGYSRSARLIDMLEENGVIGPAFGSTPREVLKKKDSE